MGAFCQEVLDELHNLDHYSEFAPFLILSSVALNAVGCIELIEKPTDILQILSSQLSAG